MSIVPISNEGNESIPALDLFEAIKDEEKELPWGRILKGGKITETCSKIIDDVAFKFGLDRENYSVGIGVMKPGAFHEPYVRVAQGSVKGNREENKNKRIYKVFSGTFICVRDGKLNAFTSKDGYIVVDEVDVFSFKAGNEGCVFAVMDFPAFDLSLDVNDVSFKS